MTTRMLPEARAASEKPPIEGATWGGSSEVPSKRGAEVDHRSSLSIVADDGGRVDLPRHALGQRRVREVEIQRELRLAKGDAGTDGDRMPIGIHEVRDARLRRDGGLLEEVPRAKRDACERAAVEP